MSSSPTILRFQGHSAGWAALTAGPLAFFSAVLLFLGTVVESTAWIIFAGVALATCLALASYRFRVVIDPAARTMRRAWCIGPLPLVRREGTLEGYDFVSLAPYTQRRLLVRRSLWQLLEPRYRVSLFGEAGTVPLGAFYRRGPAWELAEQAAGALGLDVYDKTVAEEF
jgi:hypothetical protein